MLAEVDVLPDVKNLRFSIVRSHDLVVVVDVAFGPNDLQVADIGLSSLVQLVRCLVQALANIGST